MTRIRNLLTVRKTETLMVYETAKKNRLDPMIKAIEGKIKAQA
ncbi:MAG: hypothetical protein QW265_05030 [Candidatus Bathyarchaeia archaeon]